MNNTFSLGCAIATVVMTLPWGFCRALHWDDALGIVSGAVTWSDAVAWQLAFVAGAWLLISTLAPMTLIAGVIGWFWAGWRSIEIVK